MWQRASSWSTTIRRPLCTVSRALRVDYEVDEAADGAEALAAHAATAADAIVLDLFRCAIRGP